MPPRKIDLRDAAVPLLNLPISPSLLHSHFAVEAGEAGLAGEELLHGGLFEVALLGDEPVQRAQQRIHIAQRRQRWRVVRGEVAAESATRARFAADVDAWLCARTALIELDLPIALRRIA